jgi:Ala-tRNA(Pro) deacylase
MTYQTIEALESRVRDLFDAAAVPYVPFEHEPVYTYEAAEQVRTEFGISGTETKSLFLKGKAGEYAMFVSLEGRRIDLRAAKSLLSFRPSMASPDELVSITGCEPGGAVPFGHDQSITLLIDGATTAPEQLIFSPGSPTRTVVVTQDQWQLLIQALKNVVWYQK